MATPKGATDARHTVLCAAGFNLRWLLRAIARYGLKAFFDRDR
jgi:IS5 family transposase